MYAILLASDEDTTRRRFAACLEGKATDIREPDRYTWSSADLPPANTAGQVELLKKVSDVFSFFLFNSTGKTISEFTPDLLPLADSFRRYVASLEKRKAFETVLTPPPPTNHSNMVMGRCIELLHQTA